MESLPAGKTEGLPAGAMNNSMNRKMAICGGLIISGYWSVLTSN
jgi:hypothetical protein